MQTGRFFFKLITMSKRLSSSSQLYSNFSNEVIVGAIKMSSAYNIMYNFEFSLHRATSSSIYRKQKW